MTLAEGNVGAAFGLAFASGAATMIGSSVVFFPSIVKLATRRILAGSLGFSAGVMIYISFVDIFQKSVVAFRDGGMNEDLAYGFATLCLFAGVLIMKIVEMCVHRLSGGHRPNRRVMDEDIQITWNEHEGKCEVAESSSRSKENEFVVPHCVGCSEDPVGELKKWHAWADVEVHRDHEITIRRSAATTRANSSCITDSSPAANDEESGEFDLSTTREESDGDNQDHQPGEETHDKLKGNTHGDKSSKEKIDSKGPAEDIIFRAPANSQLSAMEEKKRLVRMGLTTATAIAIHNFPEGLATFVAALQDLSAGAVLAVAIGVHNIPEGLCVSMPIYYATGSRWKAFLWGCLAGAAEPAAALIGWLVLANAMSFQLYAVLFGLVSGMMIMIATKELLPTAHRYDPEDAVSTSSAIAGMGVMALSLVLFQVTTD